MYVVEKAGTLRCTFPTPIFGQDMVLFLCISEITNLFAILLSNRLALQAMDDVLKPLLLGLPLAPSTPKIGLLSISGINKLVSYRAIHEVRSLYVSYLLQR